MAPPVQSYVWSRLQPIVGLWVKTVTGLTEDQLLWSDQNQPRPSFPYIGLTRRTFAPFGFDASQTTEVPVAVTATVTATLMDETATLILGKLPITATLANDGDTTIARDAMLAQIAASYEPVIATANGVDAIDFIGKGTYAVSVDAVENVTLSETLEFRRYTQGMRRAIVRVSLLGFDTAGDSSADEYADALIGSLHNQSDPGAVVLRQNSVGVEGAARITAQNVSLTVPSGGGGIQENRLIFDVQFNAATRRFFPANPIDDADAPVVELLGPPLAA